MAVAAAASVAAGIRGGLGRWPWGPAVFAGRPMTDTGISPMYRGIVVNLGIRVGGPLSCFPGRGPREQG